MENKATNRLEGLMQVAKEHFEDVDTLKTGFVYLDKAFIELEIAPIKEYDKFLKIYRTGLNEISRTLKESGLDVNLISTYVI